MSGNEIDWKTFLDIMEKVKQTEREELCSLPEDVALHLQSGFLLGYAECWKKILKEMTVAREKARFVEAAKEHLDPSDNSATN